MSRFERPPAASLALRLPAQSTAEPRTHCQTRRSWRFLKFKDQGSGVSLMDEPFQHVEFRLGVYRWMPTEQAYAWQRHEARRMALEAALSADDVSVEDWGLTKDDQAHEFVELAITVAASSVVSSGAWLALQWLAKELAKKAVDEGIAAGLKAILAKLRGPQQAKKLGDYFVTAPDGTRVQVWPPEVGGREVVITFRDGTQVTFAPPPAPEPYPIP